MDSPTNGGFTRELKFVITIEELPDVLAWARRNMDPDPHGGGEAGDSYRTTSLYFDTPDLAVYHGRGSFARSKYRVRRYDSSDTVFLERKLKVGSRVIKRRTEFPLARLWAADPAAVWFFDRIAVRNVRPVCQISYSRIARVATIHRSVARFTIDRDVEALPTSLLAFSNQPGQPLCERQFVVELKFRDEMPPLFASFIEDYGLTAQDWSKYKIAVRALGICQAISEPAGMAC